MARETRPEGGERPVRRRTAVYGRRREGEREHAATAPEVKEEAVKEDDHLVAGRDIRHPPGVQALTSPCESTPRPRSRGFGG